MSNYGSSEYRAKAPYVTQEGSNNHVPDRLENITFKIQVSRKTAQASSMTCGGV